MQSDHLPKALTGQPSSHILSPQDKPIAFKNAAGELASAFKVDSAVVRGRKVTLTGWATPNCTFQIWQGDQMLPSLISQNTRPDVTRRLNIEEPAAGFGFVMSARSVTGSLRTVDLRVQVPRVGRGLPEERVYAINLDEHETLPVPERQVSAEAVGVLQEAKFSSVTGDLLVVGWLVSIGEPDVWLENENGDEFSLEDSYRCFLPEVAQSHEAQYGQNCAHAGFILRRPQARPSTVLKLMISDGDTIRMLSQCRVTPMAINPVEAARWLFGFSASNRTLNKRISQIDLPLLSRLIDHSQRDWPNLPVEHRILGAQPVAPKVSLVIPLYGRCDFVEHHLIEFQRDVWLREHVEVIYVIDDRRLLDSFSTEAEQLHRLYQQPFQWVWGSVNRGYSGANNLGAAYAKGDVLLFMNSDVLPIQPGWVQEIVEALQKNPLMGAITPRLLFADGTLQHAGMKFVMKEDWGVWLNHHPLSGCPPKADPCSALTSVSAVTGACIAIPRQHFDHVGGWDTGYLIGDFEDSDMCLRLRAAGLEVGYLPTVSLTHLERQSFSFVGKGEFLQRVTLFNAVRHQQRWVSAIELSPSAAQTTSGAL